MVAASTAAVTVSALLADGTPVTASSSLGRDGTIPLYASLPQGIAALAGTVTVDPLQSGTDISGDEVLWFLRPHSGQFYPAGFGDDGLALQFLATKQSTSAPAALGFTVNPSLTFEGGPFSSPVLLNLQLTKPKTTSYSSPDAPLKFNLPVNGQFTGTCTPPGESGTYSIRGAILGKNGLGEAFGTLLTPRVTVPDGTGKSAGVKLQPN